MTKQADILGPVLAIVILVSSGRMLLEVHLRLDDRVSQFAMEPVGISRTGHDPFLLHPADSIVAQTKD